jgi:hypothetical protein
LSLLSKRVLGNLGIELNGASIDVLLDRTWYEVINSADIRFVLAQPNARLTIRTELLKMPPLTVVGEDGLPVSWESIASNPKYTSGLAFSIFIALFSATVVVSVILIVVGKFCLPLEKEKEVPDDGRWREKSVTRQKEKYENQELEPSKEMGLDSSGDDGKEVEAEMEVETAK